MGAFKTKTETEFAEKSYLSRIFVYLESEEDKLIIGDRWFYDENLEFRSSGEDTGGSGGCTMVIKKVEEDAKKGIKSVGLVDRDVLLRDCDWDSWWETDDSTLKARQPYGKDIKVLCRWEIENYLLLDPEIVESVKADRFGQEKTRPAPIPLSLDDITLLATLTAADAFCHSRGNSKVSDEMACFIGSNVDLLASLKKKAIQPADFSNEAEKANSFANGEELGSAKHWKKQSRILNGKAILKRLQLLGKKLGDPTDYRLALAAKIADENKIDNEIKEYIAEFNKI